MQLTDLATALNSIDSRTVGGYVVIKAVVNQIQIAYSHSNSLVSIATQHCMACTCESHDLCIPCMQHITVCLTWSMRFPVHQLIMQSVMRLCFMWGMLTDCVTTMRAPTRPFGNRSSYILFALLQIAAESAVAAAIAVD